MILNDIGMVAIANNRSRFYLKNLIKKEFYPAHVILLKSDQITPGQKEADLGEEFENMLKENSISYEILNTVDINSETVIRSVSSAKVSYMIYSGPGGAILKRDLLNAGKKFIHVHPGYLPDFRGSTTVYYHLLSGNSVGATAIFLEEKIDEGPILLAKKFDLPNLKNIDFDYEYDPQIRSEVLVELIENYVKIGRFATIKQNIDIGETYFIMHPILRHIAKLKLSKD